MNGPNEPVAAPLSLPVQPDRGRIVATMVGLCAFFFAAIAPTLSWVEFSNGLETLNVETVLEMRRDGPWLIPTLAGRQRINKPPLTAWFTATFVSPETVASLSNPDPVARDVAYRQVAWEIRWPSLMLACITIALTFEMGRLLAAYRVGVMAAFVAGSTFMFLRFGRMATLDVQLSFWVTLANVLLLHGMLRGRWWLACGGAGVSLGMALMTKGPVALAMTVAPLVAAVLFIKWRPVGRDDGHALPVDQPSTIRKLPWSAVALGVVCMLAVALPWFVLVAVKHPNIVEAWWREVTRVGASNLEPDPFYNHLGGPVYMLPWFVFFFVGLIMVGRSAWRGGRDAVIVLSLVIVPVVIMSCFKDKPARYLQPLLAPAAVMTAIALVGQFVPWPRRAKVDRWLAAIHWVGLFAAILCMPIAGLYFLKTVDDQPWFNQGLAIGALVGGLILVSLCTWLSRRHGAMIAIGTAVIMLAFHTVVLVGYRQAGGRSEMRPVTDHLYATTVDDVVVWRDGRRRPPPMDTFIYLNRVLPIVDSLDGATRAIVLRRGEGAPANIPAGWKIEDSWEIDRGRRWYLIRRSDGATTNPSPAASAVMTQ